MEMFQFFADFFIYHEPYTNEPYIHSFSSQILHITQLHSFEESVFYPICDYFFKKDFRNSPMDTFLKIV